MNHTEWKLFKLFVNSDVDPVAWIVALFFVAGIATAVLGQ